jgi:RHS repeat-associated protein
LSDNVTINTGQTLTIPTGEKAFAGTLNDKGILRNFGTLDMGKATSADLYSESYFYHIRGGLRGKNLDANGDLTNTLFSYKLEYEGNNGFFDGNIRNQYWKSNIDGVQRAFEYNYDKASRLTSASYGRNPQASENYALNNVSYDFNGNIINLSRNGLKSDNSFGLIDNLNYTYNTNSNKILKVDDASTETASFKDVTGNDYTYRLDGSLKSDNNKGIDSIQYNYLKLPQKIFLTSNRWIEYEYDAEGTKLKKTLSTGKYTDYEEDEIYENNVLYQITHDEGRIISGVYEYNITDHLGNLRVAFKDSSGIAKITQVNHVGAWGETLESLTYTNTPKVNNFTVSAYEKENDFGINVFDARARVYDAIAPRFWQQDIKSEKWSSYSPYNFAANNPLRLIDPDGRDIINFTDRVRFTGGDAQILFRSLKEQANSQQSIKGVHLVMEETTPNIYRHTLNAFRLGKPEILHYDSDLQRRSQRRRDAIGKLPTKLGYQRDEYPYASTFEGGLGALVEYVPSSENSSQGGTLGGLYGKLKQGEAFLVVPVPKNNEPELSPIMQKISEATGLTGTALLIYVIFSEGSRLFPPRNLVPIP